VNGSTLKLDGSALARVESWPVPVCLEAIDGAREVRTARVERRHVVRGCVKPGHVHEQMGLDQGEESCGSCDGGKSELHFR